MRKIVPEDFLNLMIFVQALRPERIKKPQYFVCGKLLHRVIYKIADYCGEKGLDNFKGKVVEVSLANEMEIKCTNIDNLICKLLEMTHDDVIGIWPEVIGSLKISELL